MTARSDRAPVWAIWLLIAFGVVQPLVWNIPGGIAGRPLVLVPILILWIAMLLVAALATRRIQWLWRTLSQKDREHRATLGDVEQLRILNAMLDAIGRELDVPQAFQELASRIERLVPCDRVGLALLSEDGKEFRTYTARPDEPTSGRAGSRPEVSFTLHRTIIGNVVRSKEPFITNDMRALAADHLDANVVATAGFRSAVIVPLLSGDCAVGTLSLVSRRANAFDRSHIPPLLPFAAILGLAWTAQQLQAAIARYRSIEAMSDLTLSMSVEINSALQTIMGICDLLRRSNDPEVSQDAVLIVEQTRRIASLLEAMRDAAGERQKTLRLSVPLEEQTSGS